MRATRRALRIARPAQRSSWRPCLAYRVSRSMRRARFGPSPSASAGRIASAFELDGARVCYRRRCSCPLHDLRRRPSGHQRHAPTPWHMGQHGRFSLRCCRLRYAGRLESGVRLHMKMTPVPRVIVRILGLLFALEGCIGLIAPGVFRALVVWLQSPPSWPGSVALRALVGILLLGLASPARSVAAVRAVGLLTLLGAVVGLVFTNLGEAPHGSIWRLPSLALLAAGLVVVWGAGKSRAAA